MWSCVAPDDVKGPAPSARAKHSATLVGDHVYLLGGRNGNLPTRDFWKYNLVSGKWQQLKPIGDTLPCLQEHSAVAYKDFLYVFGGEVGFSAGTETPLWVYDIRGNTWKKKRTKKGVMTPKGRRGHTALVYNGTMLIYGGYQDLRGSCNELWAYHFETDSWHLISGGSSASSCSPPSPPSRHKHSAILYNDSMWVYGGMTDLQERSDLWRWDLVSKTWHPIKTKLNPGPLHSHAACRLPSGMLLFGGERNGHTVNELWRFSFALETWEKVVVEGLKPQPRAETVALLVSALVLNGSSNVSMEMKNSRIRIRSCNSADRGNRHSSYIPNNKVAPFERTYIFQPSNANYNDGSDLAQQYSENNRSRSFLHEIQKLSQIRVSNKCSYTVLTGCAGDSTESLLKQHASPQVEEVIDTDLAVGTPSRGTMVKSKSAYVIKKKYHLDQSPSLEEDPNKDTNTKKRVEFDSTAIKLPRDPISVPNFAALTLPTPVLTPVEASKLVYLDSEDEQDLLEKDQKVQEKNEQNAHDSFKPVKRGDSYSSHLGYADNPLYQHMINSMQENSEENVSSTSDYASIETVNRLSSASNYSVKTGTPQEENQRNRERDKGGPFGFCNPNYLGPDIKSILNEKIDKKNVVRLLSNEEPPPPTTKTADEDEEMLELQNYNGVINQNTKVFYKHHSSRTNRPPKSLALEKEHQHQCQIRPIVEKCRALSASRVEHKVKMDVANGQAMDPTLPLFVYVFGGKEQGQVTIFQRPISIWRLKLF